jgi:ribonucleoside-diphosphate reductase alpha chain
MTREQAFKKALEYYKGNELPANVFIDKYAHHDASGRYFESTPNEMLMRAAKEFARIEQTYRSKDRKYNLNDENVIFSFFKDFKYIIPQGSVLAGIGLKDYTTLSNCFVLKSPYDSIGGIVYSDAELANVYKRRGGAGLDISNLRPKDTVVHNASKTTTGAVSFMERYSNTTKEIGMNGRRGM